MQGDVGLKAFQFLEPALLHSSLLNFGIFFEAAILTIPFPRSNICACRSLPYFTVQSYSGFSIGISGGTPSSEN
jgi:hypothetical protein